MPFYLLVVLTLALMGCTVSASAPAPSNVAVAAALCKSQMTILDMTLGDLRIVGTARDELLANCTVANTPQSQPPVYVSTPVQDYSYTEQQRDWQQIQQLNQSLDWQQQQQQQYEQQQRYSLPAILDYSP